MMHDPPLAAVAVVGLVALSDGRTLLDLGTVSKATRLPDASAAGTKLELLLYGQIQPLWLHGADADGVWAALERYATPVAELVPHPAAINPVTIVAPEPPAPPLGVSAPVADLTTTPVAPDPAPTPANDPPVNPQPSDGPSMPPEARDVSPTV